MHDTRLAGAAPKMSPADLVASFVRNRGLIFQMSKREVIGRYRGSYLGLLWSFLHPILMLLVYSFVFRVVFKTRWQAGSDDKVEFALVLFTGLIVHGLFAECANRAPGLIISNVNYVKKVVFPLEIFAWTTVGSALFHTAASTTVLLCVYFATSISLPWTALLFPVILLPLSILTVGCVWVLAAMGVFLRDITQTVGIITTVMLFLAPVFYPIEAMPDSYREFLYLNPLTFMIEQARDVLIWGRLPNWKGLAIYTGISVVVASVGYAAFQKARRGFADVL